MGALVLVVASVSAVVVVVRPWQADRESACRPLLVIETTAGDESAFQRTFIGHEGESLSEFDGKSRIGGVDVSPDGTKLVAEVATHGVFDRNGDPAAELWVLSHDGARLRRLTDSRWVVGSPEWSPDGRTILFTQRLPGNDPVFAEVASSGDGEVRTIPTQGRVWGATWSPDGQSIAYLADAGPFSQRTTLAAIATDGSDSTVIAADRPFASRISYAPDGDSLLITRQTSGVSVVDRATGSESVLVPGPGTWSPKWTTDGLDLYWSHDSEIWTGRLSGNELVDDRRVDLPGFNLHGGHVSNLDIGPC